MIFADLLFIYAFLPLNLLLYFIFKKTSYKNAVLLVFSLLFYAWGEPLMVLLLIATAEINRIFALFIEKYKKNDTGGTKSMILTAAAVILTLSSLAVFKYGGMLNLPFKPKLPIGISFYSFQIISYIIDVYKGRIPAQKSRLKFLMYVSLYPQLIAVPIVRYGDIAREADDRRVTVENFSGGITRFITGMLKKVVLANQIGAAANTVLGGDIGSLSVTGAWIGISLFALQIYYDFSGYSDMAIGLGYIFGFKFPENFNYPYISASITEFWRRWHMTLGAFFRDYVYIPLGGGKKRAVLNLLIVWFLTGLWHGASWNFALWGLYFGALIIIEKAFLMKMVEKVPRFVKIAVTLVLVVFGWAIFYFTDFNKMFIFIKSLLGLNGAAISDAVTANILYDKLFIVIIAAVFCAPVYKYIEKAAGRVKLAPYLMPFAYAAIMLVCSVLLVGGTYNPFLYYRF
jgi:alginate O-acetyltransferase complex protein AlgI